MTFYGPEKQALSPFALIHLTHASGIQDLLGQESSNGGSCSILLSSLAEEKKVVLGIQNLPGPL